MAMFSDIKSTVMCISLLQVQGIMVTSSQDKQIKVSGWGSVWAEDTVTVGGKNFCQTKNICKVLEVHFGELGFSK